MKAVLLLIFTCGIVTSSWQQNSPHWTLPQDYDHLAHLVHPRLLIALKQNSQLSKEKNDGAAGETAEGRKISGLFKDKNQSRPENRGFGINILAYNYLSSYLALSVTATSLTTTTSTVTVGTLSTCYAKALFAAVNPCRKKRELYSVLKLLDGMNNKELVPMEYSGRSLIVPTEVEPLVPTVVPAASLPSNEQASNGIVSSSLELVSSIDDGQDTEKLKSNRSDDADRPAVEAGRSKRFLTAARTTTVTSTVTSFLFYTTAATTTFQTAQLAAAGKLNCVPAGFAVC